MNSELYEFVLSEFQV